ncbi:helix-turn-helix domain-containing protein [Peribacillus acanthi]|uniref:helix-turn-helix domain-containing protein n=1 Tax=Peribacillus acanthi TaxID=2171554 RepID=UPI000D3E970F|nr:helix-turn-helix domain-containing protein [Peribacillus acanthi]
MEKEFKNKCFTYSYDLKKRAVELYFEGTPRREISEHLGIKNERIVNEWVLKVERFGWEGIKDHRGLKKGINKGRPPKQKLSLEEENKRLKAENLYLKKLIEQKRGC